LFGFGIFLLVWALAIWVFVAPSLVKTPLNHKTHTVAVDENATYLSTSEKAVEIKHGALRATRTVHGDPRRGNDQRTVFDVSLVIENNDDNTFIRAIVDRVASDRKTAQAIECCGENIDGEPVKHEGLSYKFPFGAEKKDYKFFDIVAKHAYPIRYKGEDKVKGLDVYRYEQIITDQKIGEREVPGSLVGKGAGSPAVNADIIYSNTRTVWVEPVTGIVVRGQEVQKQVLRTDGTDTLVLSATLPFNDATVTDQANTARKFKTMVTMLTVIAPLTLLFLGLILIVVGLVMVRRPGHVGTRRAESRVKEPLTT
jgi:hypothetical protein